MLRKLLTAKAIATVGAVTLATAGAAAAATGTVPSPFASDKAKEVTAERVPEIALDNVGKHSDAAPPVTETTGPVPQTTVEPDEVEPDEVEQEDLGQDDVEQSAASEGIGPDATGPAKFGLCTAYAAHVEHRDADDDPAAPSTVAPPPFRNLADSAAAAGQTVEEFCADATPGQSATAPGQAAESPSATAPGQTGESPSATAPGQTKENPSATAPGRP